MELDAGKRKKLCDEIERAFGAPHLVERWITERLSPANPNNVFVGQTFTDRVLFLVQWAEANGLPPLLQALVDFPPPAGATMLPLVVFLVSNGTIRASSAAGLPPAPAHRAWFVTQRPFADRLGLRAHLETFDRAATGADSILVIEGDRFSGKSYGARFARQCAPGGNFVSIDFAQFTAGLMNAEDLTRALDSHADRQDFPAFDLTKEAEAVPRLASWLVGKLRNSGKWIIVDHCDRPHLTDAARDLLRLLVGAIEDGSLTGVRLILSDTDRGKLPAAVRTRIRHDVARLPNVQQVTEWCQDLANALRRVHTPQEIQHLGAGVFAGVNGTPPEEASFLIEAGLARAYKRIEEMAIQP